MVKDGFVKGLMTHAKKMKDVYEAIRLRGMNDDLNKELHTLLSEEALIYSCIPLENYSDYLDYFIERLEIDPNDILSFVTLSVDFYPEVRIIQKFFYNQEKVSMFADTDIVSEDER